MTVNKADPLIRTKLRLPFTRRELVPRPRLQARVAEGLQGPLTLVVAPAGFGKTTLAASCAASSGMPVAWLSLDQNDNQTSRFLRYLIAALQGADPKIGIEAVQLLAGSQQAPPETILTSLINDMDDAGQDFVLVLDDYQFISSRAVHEEVAFLLEHCPKIFHLLIATRSDPPLPLARLRARGQTVELRASDLRFTEPEAAQFLNEVVGVHLDAGSVALLEERTEGWIAGMQMAALSMRDREDVSGFIKEFSGTNRYVLDYLLEEVLASQPSEVQGFLLWTSILERLTAPLCDAVIYDEKTRFENEGWRGASNPAQSLPGNSPFHDSRSILEHLERANLFLVALDDEREWFRYHHLFADLLRARLGQLYPGLGSQLHLRAAVWLEQEGMVVEAINHALAAGAHNDAARMVEKNTTRLLTQGKLNALMGWIELLPADLRTARPWLCVHQASALAFAGRLAGVEPLLQQAEAAAGADFLLNSPDATDISSKVVSENQALKGAAQAIRAMSAVMKGQDAEAIHLAQQALALLPAGNRWDRAAAAWALGYGLRSQGRLPEARLAFEEQIRLGRSIGNIWTLVTGLTDLAQVLRSQGQLRQARVLFEKALSEAGQQGARSLGYIARMEASLASVLYEQNELDAAYHLLTEAIAHTHQWPNPNHLAYAYTLHARVLLSRGDHFGARTSIQQAYQVSRDAALTRILRCTVEADLVRVWLAFQSAGIQLDPSDPLADQAGALVEDWRREMAGIVENTAMRMDEGAEIAALTSARVSLTAGRVEEALSLLAHVTRSARAAGLTNVTISALVLTVLAENASSAGQTVSTFTRLEEVLRLAEPGGYVRVFIDEGHPMQALLARWLAHAGAAPLRDYAARLLSQFDPGPHGVRVAQEKVLSTGNLIDPLSQRELEVLHLMALGKTNLDIARQLIVSRGTIKAHAASIYRKLDVTNRTEAVARARQLGILP